MCATMAWRRGTAADAAPLLAALLVAVALTGPGGVKAASAGFAPRLVSGVPSTALQVFGTCYFSLSPTSADVGPDGQSGSFSVGWHYEPDPEFPDEEDESVCADAWGYSSQASWISVTKSGSDTVRYTISENTTTSDRTGTVRAGGETFTVRQAAPCPSEPSVSNLAYGVGAAGGSLDVSVYEWTGCSWSVSDDRNWIRATPSSVAGGGTVRITADPNGSSSSREGTVRVGGRRIPVRQLGACPSSPGLSPSSRTVGSGGDGFVVAVGGGSHCGYAVSDDRSWINTNRSTVSGGQGVSVNVQAHSGGSPRKGTVRIGGSSFVVTQHAACPSSPSNVSPTSVEIPSGGGSRSVSVTGRSDCSWTVSDNQGWITTNPGSVRGSQSVTITAGKHTGSSVRTGTVRVGGRSVEVRQPPPSVPCPSSPDLDPSSLTLPSGGGQASVEVDEAPSCGPYGVSDNRSWITTSRSSVRGDQSLTVTVTAHTGSAARTGTVMVGNAPLLVTQEPLPCPSSPGGVSPASVEIPSGGGSRSVSVTGRSDCSWTVSDDRGWITVSPGSVSGGRSVTVTASAHTGSSVRTGTVRVGGRSVEVRQIPPSVPCPSTPVLDPSSLKFDSGGGSASMEVDESPSCGPYSVSDNQDWITTNRSSVRGDQSLTVTVPAYTGSAARTGTVMVGSASVVVTQEPPGPCPSSPSGVSPSAVNMAAGGGTEDLAVSGRNDCSWTVSDDRDWITATPSSVSGGGSVTVTLTSNSGVARTGAVAIGGQSVPVTQAAPCPAGPEGLGRYGEHFTETAYGATLVRTTVTGRSDCTWAVASTVDWVRIYASSLNVSGGGYLNFRVLSNSGVARQGSITVGSRVLSVTQEGAVNSPPTAHAGSDQTVDVGVKVSLDGSASTDPDRDALTYSWTQVSGPQVTLTYASTLLDKASFLAPAPSGDDALVFGLTVTDTDGAVSSRDDVTVTVLGQVLTGHRDRLLGDWASRHDHANACVAWKSLDTTQQEVFIWNTHRLHRSNMLPEVDELHAIYGKKDDDDCGGGEHNRTFMVMKRTLQDKFLAVWDRDGEDGGVYPAWEKTGDLACGPLSLLPFAPYNCPHWPFNYQIETHGGDPRGQINFFVFPDPIRVQVERLYYLTHGQGCSGETKWVTRDNICTEEKCSCDTGQCPLVTPGDVCVRPDHYSDRIIFDIEGKHTRGPEGDELEFSNELMFEMDQDYNILSELFPEIHASAPSCHGMRAKYSVSYGDPGWNWQPSTCAVATVSADVVLAYAEEHRGGAISMGAAPPATDGVVASVAEISGVSINTGRTPIKALHVMDLRMRIDELRERLGLSTFVWTDLRIIAGVTPIRAVHLTDLRIALDDAYAAAGFGPPEYTDAEIVAGVTPVKVVHLREIQAAAEALDYAGASR